MKYVKQHLKIQALGAGERVLHSRALADLAEVFEAQQSHGSSETPVQEISLYGQQALIWCIAMHASTTPIHGKVKIKNLKSQSRGVSRVCLRPATDALSVDTIFISFCYYANSWPQ